MNGRNTRESMGVGEVSLNSEGLIRGFEMKQGPKKLKHGVGEKTSTGKTIKGGGNSREDGSIFQRLSSCEENGEVITKIKRWGGA